MDAVVQEIPKDLPLNRLWFNLSQLTESVKAESVPAGFKQDTDFVLPLKKSA